MTDPAIERVTRAWTRGWFENDRQAFLEVVHPDLELYLPRSAIEGTVYRGLEGAKQAFADGHATWSRFELLEPTTEVLSSGEWHLTVSRVRLTPRGSGPAVEYDAWWLFRLEGAQAIYAHPYQDRDEAIAAFERATASE